MCAIADFQHQKKGRPPTTFLLGGTLKRVLRNKPPMPFTKDAPSITPQDERASYEAAPVPRTR